VPVDVTDFSQLVPKVLHIDHKKIAEALKQLYGKIIMQEEEVELRTAGSAGMC